MRELTTAGEVFRLIYRDMKPKLINCAELDILLFIYDRTWSFGKPAEVIPYRHFTDGIHLSGTGRYIASPLMCGRSTLIKSLQRLERAGMIARRRIMSGEYAYTINTSWRPRKRIKI